jgi:hypothetical protein
MNQIHAILYDLLKSIFNIISTSTPVSSMWSHFFGFPTKTLNVFPPTPLYLPRTIHFLWAHGSAVGWGTALQVGMSRVRFPVVSLEFFIYIILLSALWPWGGLSLSQKWVPGIFPEVKVDNITTFLCRLSWNPGASTSWNPQGLSRPVQELYLFTSHFLCFVIGWNISHAVSNYLIFPTYHALNVFV